MRGSGSAATSWSFGGTPPPGVYTPERRCGGVGWGGSAALGLCGPFAWIKSSRARLLPLGYAAVSYRPSMRRLAGCSEPHL